MKLDFNKTLLRCVSVIVFGTGALVQGQAHAQRIPVSRPARPQMVNGTLNAGPGAFVSHPVNTTDELLHVLQNDKAARQRYAKHFRVSEDKVVEFVKNALIITPLDKTRTVTNYYIGKNGVIKSHREVMPKGTKVWSTRSGLPIFKWICANPLTDRLPGPVVLTDNPVRSANTADLLTPSPAPQTDGLRSQIAVPDIAANAPLVGPDEEGATEYARAPIPLSSIAGSGVGSIGGFPTSAAIGGLLATPFVIPLVTGGGGNNGGGFNAGGGGAPVPEPTSLAFIGASLPVTIGLYRRRKRSVR